MDTREKIITAARARQEIRTLRRDGIAFHLVTGYFDVLQPATVQDLQQLAKPGMRLFAIVLDPPRPMLSPAARRELAAALRVIDYVVQTDADSALSLLAEARAEEAIHHEQAHTEIAERLIQHVFERHARPFDRRPSH